jgi:hypothetical protein
MDSPWHLLPPDLIELQIGQIDLLLAMYPDELTLSESATATLDIFRDNSNTEKSEATVKTTPSISALLDLPITSPSGTEELSSSSPGSPQTLRLDLNVPFAYQENEVVPTEPPPVKVRIQQPNWLSKAATSQLTSCISPADDLLSTIDLIHDKALLQLSQQDSSLSSNSSLSSSLATTPLVRAWFYFPSISTRSKRDDLVTHAPAYQLTGFLFAGKPGVLCVEGSEADIDAYMRFIKTESWGDIPAHHKKVSERFREAGVEKRAFGDMSEITDTVGERRGARVNRGDMKAVEEWLVERGLGEAFARVLM